MKAKNVSLDLGTCLPSAQDLLRIYMRQTWAGTPCVVFIQPDSSSPEFLQYLLRAYEVFGRTEIINCPCAVYPCTSMKEARTLRGKKAPSYVVLWDGKQFSKGADS